MKQTQSYSSIMSRGGTRRILSKNGDFNLLASVVLLALEDLKRPEPVLRSAAWAWLSSDRRGLCSFRWYCETLSLNRALVLRIASEKHTDRPILTGKADPAILPAWLDS